MDAFAAARLQRIRTLATIRAAEVHGRRLDETSKKRVDAGRTPLNLAASQYSPDDPLALEAAFKAFKQSTGVIEGKNAAIMAHVIAIISPEVLAEIGDARDPKNQRVRALFEQSQAWARAEFGPEALIAARLDVDEAGAGIVDLFVCPMAMQTGGRGRTAKLTISVKGALEALASREKELQGWDKPPKSFRALQDSWGRWAGERIDPRLKRGKPKRETQRQHVHADIFRERAEELKRREAELDRQQHAEAVILAAFQKGDISRAAETDGKVKLTMADGLIGSAEHRELAELSSHIRPELRQMLASVTAEREKAAEDRRQVMLAIETGVQAMLAGEITGVKQASQDEWKIDFSSDLDKARKGFLSRIIEPLKAIVGPILAAIRNLLTHHEVEIESYAEAVKWPSRGSDNGPGM